MRDHPYHSEAIMGGMWGCRPKELLKDLKKELKLDNLNSIEQVIELWMISEWEKTQNNEVRSLKPNQYHSKGIDQRFLREVLYDILYRDAYIHDSFPAYNCFSGRFDFQPHLKYKETNTGFPCQRGEDWNDFVGQVYDENDIPNEEYAELMSQRDHCIYMDWKKED